MKSCKPPLRKRQRTSDIPGSGDLLPGFLFHLASLTIPLYMILPEQAGAASPFSRTGAFRESSDGLSCTVRMVSPV